MSTYGLIKDSPNIASKFIHEKKKIKVTYERYGLNGIHVGLRCTYNTGQWDIEATFNTVQAAQDFVDSMIADARVTVAQDIERLKAHGYY